MNAGYTVHVFVLLSRNKKSLWNHGQYNRASLQVLGEAELEAQVREQVAAAGGAVKLFKLYDQIPLQQAEFGKFEQFNRMLKSSEHLLQQFHGMYLVWQHVKAAEIHSRQIYDIVIRQRNDAYWFQELPLELFPMDQVSVKMCLDWGGTNDKYALVPRQFAPAWFEVVYDYYINGNVEVYLNPEKFVAQIMADKKIPIWHGSANVIPTVDFRHYQNGGCFPGSYFGFHMECIPEAHRKYAVSRACK